MIRLTTPMEDYEDDVFDEIGDAVMPKVHRGCDQNNNIEHQIQQALKDLIVDDTKLQKVMHLLLKEMEHGLSRDWENSTVKMLPSYVRSVPNGTETGNFFALDLGGTNFRVLLIRLRGKEAPMTSKIFRIPHDIMVGSGAQLFDHIAACLAEFMKEEDLIGQKLPLGFTFSFPCTQYGLTCAKLINWTKGFKCDGVEGEDVVKLLQEAVHRRGDIDIDVVALLNDTTGTLMACAHSENSCNVGVIVGTGSNACYMEKINRIPKLELEDVGPDEVIVNTEWGAFGDNKCLEFIRTPYDREVDEGSVNPGRQLFEKMISGMYMGEIVRCALVKLIKDGLLFGGEACEKIHTPGAFPTKFVSEIESDLMEEDKTFAKSFDILEDLGMEGGISAQDCANVAYVCSLVSTRAAYLCAAGIAVLLNRMARPFCTVGIDGSVYRFHPTFKDLLAEKTGHLTDPALKFKVMLSEDGSGRGAALVAAVACRVEEEKREHARQKLDKLKLKNGPVKVNQQEQKA